MIKNEYNTETNESSKQILDLLNRIDSMLTDLNEKEILNKSLAEQNNTLVLEIAGLNETINSLESTNSILALQVQELNEQIEDLKQQLSKYLGEANRLRGEKYGSKSETMKSLGLEEEDSDEEDNNGNGTSSFTAAPSKGKPKKRKPRKSNAEKFSDIKEVIVKVDLEDSRKFCSKCHTALSFVTYKKMRDEIHYVPGHYERRIVMAAVYECRNCRKNALKAMLVTAPLAPAVIPHSFMTSSLAAQVLTEKFCFAMPYHRQVTASMFKDLPISRNTLSAAMIRIAKTYFKPLVDLMKKILLTFSYIHSDDTTMPYFRSLRNRQTRKKYKGFFWFFGNDKYAEFPIRIFEFHTGRSGDIPRSFLEGFKGTLICDAYQGYGKMDGVIKAGCMAHLRRDFTNALKGLSAAQKKKIRPGSVIHRFLEAFSKLFKYEKEVKGQSFETIAAKRQKESAPVFRQLIGLAIECNGKVQNQDAAKGIKYLLNHQEELGRFLEDPRVPLTNSLAEREMKQIAVGRKNWLFAGSVEGAEAAGICFSVVLTAIANNLNPYKYIEYLLEQMAPKQDDIQTEDLEKLLPWNKEIQEKFFCKGAKNHIINDMEDDTYGECDLLKLLEQ